MRDRIPRVKPKILKATSLFLEESAALPLCKQPLRSVWWKRWKSCSRTGHLHVGFHVAVGGVVLGVNTEHNRSQYNVSERVQPVGVFEEEEREKVR